MYSSVKFFDPTVIATLPLAGLETIRLSELSDALVDEVVLLPPPPHAAMVTASTAATDSVNAARTRRPLITPSSFPAGTVRPTQPITGILCGAGAPLRLRPPGRHEPLHAREHGFDGAGEPRDDDRTRHHAIGAVDVR